MMNMIAEPIISWSEQSKTCKGSNQRHQVQQQNHIRNRLMLLAKEEDSEDEAVEEALAVVVDRSLVTTVEL